MRNKYKKWLKAALVIFVITTPSFSHSDTDNDSKKTYTEEELGLRHESLYDESATEPVQSEPIKKEAGESTRIERAFENSPPLIPHDITGMLPMAQTENICMGCHMPEEAKSMGAVSIPKSHLVDLNSGKDLKGKLDGDRYNCMQCHAIQTVISAPIKNIFKSEFRDPRGQYNSNLIDILNEGVQAE